MKRFLIPAVLSLVMFSACQPGPKQNHSQSIDSLLDDTVTSEEGRQIKEEKSGSAKVSFEKSYTAPNGIQFNITTLGDDSLRQMQIIAVRDGIFLTDIMEEIVGELIIVRITDLNDNDNPELLIFTETRDDHEYWHFYAYEFSDKDWNKIYFPELSEEALRGYRGEDVYRLIGRDMLRRTFPVFLEKDSTKSSGGKRVIEYMLNEKGEMYIDTILVNKK
ncbi:hypothetical protein [Anseongella ginsenosidimutans]|nr:hypothetical protein [Anseongella ginsenosidimutans]QEC51081.1 hypothetical protein FRZ59_01080 [Anseongella ginsenosidimutans]